MLHVKTCLFGLILLISHGECYPKHDKFKSAPLVTTTYGQIRGIQDTNASMYLGIPYVQPPVGNLRWKDPVDVKPWKPKILEATDFKPACPQLNCGPVSACPNIVIFFLAFTIIV